MKRTKQFRINLSEDELAELKQLAEWQRVSSADVLRQAIRAAYQRQKNVKQIDTVSTYPPKVKLNSLYGKFTR